MAWGRKKPSSPHAAVRRYFEPERLEVPKIERRRAIIAEAYEKYNFNIEPTPPVKRETLIAKFFDISELPYGGAGSRKEYNMRFRYFMSLFERIAVIKRLD